MTCRQLQTEESLPLTLPVTDILRHLQIAYFVAALPLSIAMNSLVIGLVIRFKTLRTVTFLLALQIIVVDMVCAIIIFPTATVNAITKRNVFTHICPLIGIGIFFLQSLRTILMSVLVMDRFLSVFMAYQYPKYQAKVTTITSLIAWGVASIISLIPTAEQLDCYSFEQYIWVCTLTSGCTNKRACLLYDSLVVIILHLSNMVALLLYLILYCKARQLRNRVDVIPHTQQDGTDLRAERQRQERKANVTFFLLFLSLLGISLPNSVFFELRRLGHTSIGHDNADSDPHFSAVIVISRTLYTLLLVVDPLVIIRDRDVREAIMASFVAIKMKIHLRVHGRTLSEDSRISCR